MNTKDITVNGIEVKVRSGRVKLDFLPYKQIFWHGQLCAMEAAWAKEAEDQAIIAKMELPIIIKI